jgi:hypothetical protein
MTISKSGKKINLSAWATSCLSYITEAATGILWEAKIQYFYVILSETGHGMTFLDHTVVIFVKLSLSLGEKYVL